jgi:hypothetical protein
VYEAIKPSLMEFAEIPAALEALPDDPPVPDPPVPDPPVLGALLHAVARIPAAART